MLSFLKKILGLGTDSSVDFSSLLEQGAIIVDVRTPGEYKSGHIDGAMNIPLDMIASSSKLLKSKNVPVITCCRSGARSGAAASILRNMGIEAVNGGPWDSLNRKI
jgi:phage shock protein E